MSAISAGSGLASGATQTNRMGELDSQEFLGIILAELQAQDPLAPNDTNALVQQLSSVRSIESDLQLTEKLESLVTDNRLASATSMVGRRVEGIDEADQTIVGTVAAVRTRDGAPTLLLQDGSTLPLDRLTGVGEYAELLP
ncbi:MAG: flagellar hook capping FlgD N-terminal domain-containing protein [Phycisphaerales bacterium]|jgi:flagellar basal-body rod modification protein FlgD